MRNSHTLLCIFHLRNRCFYFFVHVCPCHDPTKNRACCISDARSPLFQTTWSARLIFSSSGICELIICLASALFIDIRFRKRAICTFCEQATTTTRSHKLSPPVS